MANGYDGEKQFPLPLNTEGKGYSTALKGRSSAILSTLQGYLASTYQVESVSAEHAQYLKSMAIEMARFTLALEQINDDVSFDTVRSEFISQIMGRFVFLNQQPELELDDESYRQFLLTIIDIYFRGATPDAIRRSVELFTSQPFVIRELFKEAQSPNSPYDISDQFSFVIEFDLNNTFPGDIFTLQNNLELLLNIVKPAHTLFTVGLRFTDDVIDDEVDPIEDELTQFDLALYHYDDVRKYWGGMEGWSSQTGYIESSDLFVLKDDEDSSPLHAVQPGASLLIRAGVNAGRYVVEESGQGFVKVRPRFRSASNPQSYEVEVDRLGAKKELFYSENLSGEYQSAQKLSIQVQGPTQLQEGTSDSYQVFVNFPPSGVESYEWDFTGDGSFTDATGDVVTFTAPMIPAGKDKMQWLIGAKVITKDQRKTQLYYLIEIVK